MTEPSEEAVDVAPSVEYEEEHVEVYFCQQCGNDKHSPNWLVAARRRRRGDKKLECPECDTQTRHLTEEEEVKEMYDE